MSAQAELVHDVSVVIPVYQGAHSLRQLTNEIASLVEISTTPHGRKFRIAELVLVDDCGPDGSSRVIKDLSTEFQWVRPVWLSRNYGQHAATLAGMAATSSRWIVSLDEDLQHDPKEIGKLLDTAVEKGAQVVYGNPSDAAPHGLLRNVASRLAKVLSAFLTGNKTPRFFSSFRLVSGEIGRSVAAYAGEAVYLDVALSWITQTVLSTPVNNRAEHRSKSGYTRRSLLSHFWKLVLSSGTRPLRVVSITGLLVFFFGFVLAVYIAVRTIFFEVNIAGWSSVIVLLLLLGGAALFALGVIAEYLGLVVRSVFGKPAYLVVQQKQDSPLDAE
jgi:undecaprenyl-phosphate 4-deoxy-4-formamido-L-arabinose transferase